MLRCYLNSTLLINEPKGLKDASIEISRGGAFRGLISSFIADLEFWGDGYALLLLEAQTNAPCREVTVLIEDDCEAEPIFEGIIYTGDIVFNEMKCTAVATIEDDTLAGRVTRLLSTKVRLGLSSSFSGAAITPYVGENINFGGTTGTRKGFKILPLIQYVLDYLTDGQMTINAGTIFTTDYRPETYTLTCIRNGATPFGDVTFEWVDIYGQTQTDTIAITPAQSTNNAYASAVGLALQEGSFGDGLSAYFVSTPANIITASFFSPAALKLITTSATGTVNGQTNNFTFTPTQSFTYGLQNVYMTSGAILNESTAEVGQVSISLSDLLSILGIYNIDPTFRKVGTSYELDLDIEANTYIATTSATLAGIKQITTAYSQPLAPSSLDFKQQYTIPSNAENYYLLVNEVSYVGNFCSEFETKVNPVAGYAITENFADNNGNFQTSDLFLLEANGGNIAQYQLGWDAFVFGLLHYASGLSPFVAKNHVFKTPDGLAFNGYQIENNSAVKLQQQNNFVHPITRAQIRAILTAPQNKIVFNGRGGYVSNVKYNIKNGMTEFELFTQ